MKKILLFIVVSFLFVSCKTEMNTTSNGSETAIQQMNVIDFKEAIASKRIQLIDVRTPEEYAEGHIENAVNIDFLNETFEQKIQKIRKRKPVYIYCRSGGRSARAATAMEKLGFKKIIDLQGGFMAWE